MPEEINFEGAWPVFKEQMHLWADVVSPGVLLRKSPAPPEPEMVMDDVIWRHLDFSFRFLLVKVETDEERLLYSLV